MTIRTGLLLLSVETGPSIRRCDPRHVRRGGESVHGDGMGRALRPSSQILAVQGQHSTSIIPERLPEDIGSCHERNAVALERGFDRAVQGLSLRRAPNDSVQARRFDANVGHDQEHGHSHYHGSRLTAIAGQTTAALSRTAAHGHGRAWYL